METRLACAAFDSPRVIARQYCHLFSPANAQPTEWLQESGCDAWVLHQNTRTPSEYAELFIETGYIDAPDCSRHFNRWLEYYAGRGIAGIAAGNIIMRRRSGEKNWMRKHPLEGVRVAPGCDQRCSRSVICLVFIFLIEHIYKELKLMALSITSIRLDKRLADEAAEVLGVKSRTEAIHAALREIVALKRFKKLMSKYGGKLEFSGHDG